jgi:hypothetical protein
MQYYGTSSNLHNSVSITMKTVNVRFKTTITNFYFYAIPFVQSWDDTILVLYTKIQLKTWPTNHILKGGAVSYK